MGLHHRAFDLGGLAPWSHRKPVFVHTLWMLCNCSWPRHGSRNYQGNWTMLTSQVINFCHAMADPQKRYMLAENKPYHMHTGTKYRECMAWA